ncbi:MAG: ATP-dependent Clp protease ATP-binding subunit ClpA [Candidatus Wallbacteria bacterium]|nr:ATP-dependent Clp protease ATP-binding subunit ClpA [Candidatus Wallbacteria bacterium]
MTPELSPELEVTIQVAMTEAARRGHELATLEHLLYALVLDDETREVLRHAGADLTRLKRDLDRFLRDELAPSSTTGEVRPTLAFSRAVQRAQILVVSSGKRSVTGPHVLVALYAEPDSYATQLLEEQGVTRLDIINFISHRVSKPASPHSPQAPGPDGTEAPPPMGDPLESFCLELVHEAAAGRIDPLVGRDKELKRTIEILARRRKNNPILVGDPGVGKTAIVEGLARAIHEKRVPPPLARSTIWSLDMGAMLAGTRFRGDFEERIKGVLKRVEEVPGAILFIDEIHTVVGAGITNGSSMDVSNLLKPALTRGKVRCIGSSTFQDYRQHLERDRALARRFQKVDVTEPSVPDTVRILRGLRSHYESFHGVRYTDKAIRAAAELAARHLRERLLPDKAIDLMDEAGAVRKLAGRAVVRSTDIERVVARMARVPPKQVTADARQNLAALADDLKRAVFGQEQAIDELAAAIKQNRAGLGQPERPVGCFLFTGPTGVGKTEVAKQLAKTMGIALLRFDMSEYMERHTVSRLVGAPPGYVGYDRGGLLTEAVSQNPHAVLLLDEIEKAHPDVFNILLQVMDHGTLTDTNGKQADFRNVILLMTSNVGARELASRRVGFEGKASASRHEDDRAYQQMFAPEFRNRLDARIAFKPLAPETMTLIVDKFLREVAEQLAARKVELVATDAARALLAKKGYDPIFGARPMQRVVRLEVKRPLADDLLFGKLKDGGRVVLDGREDQLVFEATGNGGTHDSPSGAPAG